MMKERFSKLLLGEDMSGCGNGVSTALAISNAITNLCGKQKFQFHMRRSCGGGGRWSGCSPLAITLSS